MFYYLTIIINIVVIIQSLNNDWVYRNSELETNYLSGDVIIIHDKIMVGFSFKLFQN